MHTLKAFIVLSRPHFLLGGILLFALGASTSATVAVAPYVWAQLMVSSAQITAHYVNEYADLAADRLVANRTMFSGGSGVLAHGGLAPVIAIRAAAISSLVAASAAVAVAQYNAWAALFGIVALLVSWAYSMPPVRLLNTGAGELATSLVVVVIVPTIGALANGGRVDSYLVWSMAGLLFMHMAMMLVFELPDMATDATAGKRVLAVRLGRARTVVAIAALYLVPVLGWLALAMADEMPPGVAATSIVVAVLAGAVAVAIRRDAPHWFTAGAVAVLVSAAIGLLIAAPTQLGS